MLNESLKDKWLHHVRIQDIQSKKNSMAMWQSPYLSPMWMEGRGGMGPAQGRKVGRNRREGTFCYQEPLSEIASVVTLLYICKKKIEKQHTTLSQTWKENEGPALSHHNSILWVES